MRILAALCSLSFMSPCFALATVESRTGEPVIRNVEPQMPRVVQEGGARVDESLRVHETPYIESTASPAIPARVQASSHAEEQRALRLTLSQMEALQREIGELRGIIEVQDHEIKQLKKSQQDLFLDLERRLNENQVASQLSGTAVKTDVTVTANAAATIAASKNANSSSKSADKTADKATSKTSDPKKATKTADKSVDKTSDPKATKTAAKTAKSSNTASQNRAAPSLITPETSEDLGVISAKPNPAPAVSAGQATASTIQAATTSTSKPAMTIRADDPGKEDLSKNAVGTPHDSTKVNTQSNPNPVNSAMVISANLNENDSYQAAYGHVRSKRYPEAVQSLQDYIKRFPEGTQAANAHYWLAEVYMVQWQSDKSKTDCLEKANEEFKKVSTQYANHAKAGDAVLKLGLIELDKGDAAAARQYLTEVKTRYPNTAAARIADTRLQQIR